MPAKLDRCVKEIRAGWKKNPGSKPTIRAGQTEEGTAIAICRASLKLEEEQAIQLEGGLGPVLIDAAVTAKPHLRQRGKEVRIVEIDGKEYVEVPLFRQGIYRHPKGRLVFNDAFFDAMIKNHENAVTDYNVHLDFRHSDKMGALAFLDKQDGGWLEKKDRWLFAYGPPAGEEEKALIKSRKWRYASAHFYKDYKSNFVTALSSDNLEEVTHQELLEQEVTMPKKIQIGDTVISLNEDDGVYALGDQAVDALETLPGVFQALSTRLEEQEGQIEAYQQRVTQLEEAASQSSDDDDEPELPEKFRLQLEENARALDAMRQERHKEQVAFIMKNAREYRDKNGNGHDESFLNLLKAGLTLEQFEDGAEAIKLEDSDDPVAIRAYFQNLLRVMSETNLGTVPMNGQTQPADVRLESGLSGPNNRHFTQEELDAEIEGFSKIRAE